MSNKGAFNFEGINFIRNMIVKEYENQKEKVGGELKITNKDDIHPDNSDLDIIIRIKDSYGYALYSCHELSQRYTTSFGNAKYVISFSNFKSEEPKLEEFVVRKIRDFNNEKEQTLSEHVSEVLEGLEDMAKQNR